MTTGCDRPPTRRRPTPAASANGASTMRTSGCTPAATATVVNPLDDRLIGRIRRIGRRGGRDTRRDPLGVHCSDRRCEQRPCDRRRAIRRRTRAPATKLKPNATIGRPIAITASSPTARPDEQTRDHREQPEHAGRDQRQPPESAPSRIELRRHVAPCGPTALRRVRVVGVVVIAFTRLSTTARMPTGSAPSAIDVGGFVQRGEQHRREEIDGSDDEAPGGVGRAQHLAHEPEPVPLRDLVAHLRRQAPRGRRAARSDGPRASAAASRNASAPSRRLFDRIAARRRRGDDRRSHRSRSTSSYTAAKRSSFDAKW